MRKFFGRMLGMVLAFVAIVVSVTIVTPVTAACRIWGPSALALSRGQPSVHPRRHWFGISDLVGIGKHLFDPDYLAQTWTTVQRRGLTSPKHTADKFQDADLGRLITWAPMTVSRQVLRGLTDICCRPVAAWCSGICLSGVSFVTRADGALRRVVRQIKPISASAVFLVADGITSGMNSSTSNRLGSSAAPNRHERFTSTVVAAAPA